MSNSLAYGPAAATLHRIVTINGADQGAVRDDLIVTCKAGLDVALIESNRYLGANEVECAILHAGGAGRLLRLLSARAA